VSELHNEERAMSDEKSAAAKSEKRSGMPMIALVMGFVLVVGLGGGGWFVFHSKKSAEAAPPAPAAASGVKSVMHLESFVINLEDSEGSGYLRVGIDLGLESEVKEGPESKAYESQVRDTILEVLGTRSADDLLTAEGKTKLKEDLLKAIQQKVPEIHCHEIYFTEFLVQR
jgi:flagellar protein FliL